MSMKAGLQFVREILFLNLFAESDSLYWITAIFYFLAFIVYSLYMLDFLYYAPRYPGRFGIFNSDCVWIGETPCCISVLAFDLMSNRYNFSTSK